jgi:bis(5'-adenosyl)-triphosphatase
VQHVHVHIIPRKGGDLKNNDEIYERLDKKDSEPPRTSEDMAQEALELRAKFHAAETEGCDKGDGLDTL